MRTYKVLVLVQPTAEYCTVQYEIPRIMTEEGKCAIHDASKGTNLADWRRAILHVTLCASTNSSRTADIRPNLMRASIFDFTHNCNSEIAKWSTLW